MPTRELNRNVSEKCKIKLVNPDNYYSLQFTIEAGQEVIIGRSDEHIEFYPTVDLSNLGAYGLGVSRTHAVLILSEGKLHIADMSSKGTQLNGKFLPKGKPYPVENHSLLTFGELNFHIIIQAMDTALLTEDCK